VQRVEYGERRAVTEAEVLIEIEREQSKGTEKRNPFDSRENQRKGLYMIQIFFRENGGETSEPAAIGLEGRENIN
jgi:hypothetical protein